jgi:hypothetical protein
MRTIDPKTPVANDSYRAPQSYLGPPLPGLQHWCCDLPHQAVDNRASHPAAQRNEND